MRFSKARKTDEIPDDFIASVLQSMGKENTPREYALAINRGVNFENLYKGTPVIQNEPRYCWRKVRNRRDEHCKKTPCKECKK